MTGTETDALVIRSLNYGESDRIVTAVTERFGRVRGIAKGARRSMKRFGGCLEPFAQVRITLHQGRGLGRIEEGRVVRDFRAVKEDLLRLACGSYMMELTEAFFAEEVEGDGAYGALLAALTDLSDAAREPEAAVREFEVKLLGMTGYLPSFTRCALCGCDAVGGEGKDGEAIPFSRSRGGVLCPRCHPAERSVDFVSPGTLRTLAAAAGRRVLFTRHALEESGRILPPFIAHHLGRPMKSLGFIGAMRGVS